MELQAGALGDRASVDLPRSIEASSYYAHVLRRSATEDTPKKSLRDLRRYLENEDRVWDNSWVRLPRRCLCPFADSVFQHDLLADKSCPSAGLRSDAHRFLTNDGSSSETVRVPVSYLLKLALADALGTSPALPDDVARTGRRVMAHFLNDHVSPETFSFYVVPLRPEAGLGRGLAKESSLRYLLAQLLVMYANRRFELERSGQTAILYFSPHAPTRQRELAQSVPDSFYRELFTSPCLSGWDQGEAKQEYMHLCHQVLSRSQLHAMAKIRDAGLTATNLALLPSLSNVSLANNGTHISLGSLRLKALLEDRSSGFGPAEEKLVGDLVIKIVEHFLPLLVGTYSAAPYRLDFADFHVEHVLGFLPHELDYTHLRMLWRRWKKKADVRFLGQPISPSGYRWLDRLMSFVLGLKGDFVPDFRLLDYFVAPLSTHQCPALDGQLGNQDRLKRDLSQQGIYDPRMAFYSMYRLREYARMGYTGFEGRIFSLFDRLGEDLRRATDVQNLITALAFQYILEGRVTHESIPDDPSIESERRQIFFGTAVGIPTFFVRNPTGNRFLAWIIGQTQKTRPSNRYAGYVRVYNIEYRRALLNILQRDAAGLVEMMGLGETLADLRQRIESPERCSAAGRLTGAILDELNVRSPLAAPAAQFNQAAERYYRESLRQHHLREAFDFLDEDLRSLGDDSAAFCRSLKAIGVAEGGIEEFARRARFAALADRASLAELRGLIQLVLWNIHKASERAGAFLAERSGRAEPTASIR